MKSFTGKLPGIVDDVYIRVLHMHTAFCLERSASIVHIQFAFAAAAVAHTKDGINQYCACMMNHLLLCCRYGNDMHTRNWSWLIFFGVQGVIVGLEGFGKKLMTKTGFNMPHWLAVCVTVSVQMWLAHALFFPALTDARLPVKLRGALLRNYHSLVGVAL